MIVKTLNQINQEWEDFFTQHRGVNSYYYGDWLDVYTSNKINHTTVIMQILDIVPGQGANNGSYYFDVNLILTCADKVYDDRSNWEDVKNDTFLILSDAVTVLRSKRWTSFSKFVGGGTIKPFRQRGGAKVDGHFTELTLRIISNADICALPLIDYDFGADYAPSCRPVIIYINGIFYESAPSGSTVNITQTGSPATVRNTNNTYSTSVASGGTLILPDQSVEIFLDSVSQGSTTYPAMTNPTINVLWT